MKPYARKYDGERLRDSLVEGRGICGPIQETGSIDSFLSVLLVVNVVQSEHRDEQWILNFENTNLVDLGVGLHFCGGIVGIQYGH